MKLSTAGKLICFVALVGASIAPKLQADEWNKKTVVTFGEPVEIPGVHLKGYGVLPAGTYVFKLMDSQSDRNIVQIWNKDETTIYATILAIPDSRLKATDKTVITFDERPAGEPVALRAWFYPGSTTGEEFVYPKARAMDLAKANNSAVLFTTVEMPVEVTEQIKTADVPAVVAMKTAPVKAVQPTGEETEVATAPANALPSTASNAPLIGLLGLMALSGSLILGSAAKQVR